MRKLFIFIFILFAGVSLHAQDTLTLFYNDHWEKVNEEQATFSRKAVLVKDLWRIADFYKSGKPEKTGFLKSMESNEKQGDFVYYYENGARRMEGQYYRNFKVGMWKSWYETGAVRSKEQYLERPEDIDALLKDGILSLGYSLKTGKYFVDSGGVFNGVSRWFYPDGQKSAEEKWEKELVSVKHWNEKGKSLKVFKNDFDPVEGVLTIPTINKDRLDISGLTGITGKVYVGVVIDEKGKVGNVRLARSSGNEEVDKKIIDFIKATDGLWEPGRYHNLPVTTECTVPLSF